MAKFKKWKNKNRNILKEFYDPTITDPKPPKPPKELKQNGKKLKRGGKV